MPWNGLCLVWREREECRVVRYSFSGYEVLLVSTCIKVRNSDSALCCLGWEDLLLSSVPATSQHCHSLWIVEKKLNFNFVLWQQIQWSNLNLDGRNNIMEDYWSFVQIGFFFVAKATQELKTLMDQFGSVWISLENDFTSQLWACPALSCGFLVSFW